MIALLIAMATLAQILGYTYVIKKQKPFLKWAILLLILVCHLFVFPKFFYPSYDADQVNCGMPIIAAHILFIIFGIPLTMLTHLFYYLTYGKNLKQK